MIEREQTPAFDVKEVRSHDDEFAGYLDVQFFERFKILEILAGDAFDRDVVNVELVALDQIQQQIEWALEDFEFDLVVRSHWRADNAAHFSASRPGGEPKHYSRCQART